MFDTGRTILRAYRDADFNAVLALWNTASGQAVWFISDYPVPRSETYAKEIIAMLSKGFFAMTEDKETGEVIGQVRLTPGGARNRDGSIGIGVKEELRGKGVGKEVMRWIVAYSMGSRKWGCIGYRWRW